MPHLSHLPLPRLPSLALVARRRAIATRRLLARHPWVYWFLVGLLATGAYGVVALHTAARDAARADWGTTAPVVVAASAIAPGDALDGRVAVVEWPVAIVPAGVLSEVARGAVARQHVAAGEPLGRLDVAAASGPLALVPDGWSAVAVVESPTSGAAVGDRVQVASEGVVLAGEGLVVGRVEPDVTLVAVPADVAPLIPAAADAGHLALLRVP